MIAADKHFWQRHHSLVMAASFVLFVFAWQTVSFLRASFALPDPIAIELALDRLVRSGVLVRETVVTVSRLIVGVLLAIPVGLLVGSVLRRWEGQLLLGAPFAIVSKVAPTAWGPLAIVVVGLNNTAMWSVVTLAVAPPLALAIMRDEEAFADADSAGSGAKSLLRRPALLAGLRAGVFSGFAALVAAEFVGSSSGLGGLLSSSSATLRVPEIYVLILCLAGVGFGLEACIDRLQSILARRSDETADWNLQPAVQHADRSATNLDPAHG